MNRQRGFTLLEVLVALAVFALLASAVVSASGYVLGQRGGLQDRLFAAWLADNHIAELHLQPKVALGQRQFTREMDGRHWPLLESASLFVEPGLIQVEIQVGHKNAETILHHATTWLEHVDVAR